MLDFKHELHRLLQQETQPLPQDELAEIVQSGRLMLSSLNKKQSDISLQVEEIYDIVGNMDTAALQEALQAEKGRAGELAAAVVGLCDILEDFRAYAAGAGEPGLEEQARLMWKNAGRLIERCGFIRLGDEGQPLDPEIHTVQSAVSSPVPREHVARVLQSGYRHLGTVVRRAAVVVSKGMEDMADE